MDGKSSNWRPGPSVCRCCLSDGCYKDIATEYFWMGKREVYEEMLVDTLGLTISFGDSNAQHSQSRLICETCISRLRNATDFKKQVKECEQTFLQYLNPSTLDVVEDVISLEKEEKQVTVKEEKSPDHGDDFNDNNDFLDDDNDDELDDQPLMNLATKVPKKESVDVFDLLDNAKPLVKRKSTTKAKTTSSKKAKIKETKTKPKEKPEKKKKGSDIMETEVLIEVKPCRKLKEHVGERQMRRRRRANNELSEDAEKRLATKMMKLNAKIILDSSSAYPFRWYRGAFCCCYCDKRFLRTEELRGHNSLNHSYPKQLKLIFEKLKGNNALKIDVSDLKCRFCCVRLTDIEDLKKHLALEHNKILNNKFSDGVIPFNFDLKNFQCTKCAACFTTFSKINEHMNCHYKNFVCEACGKAFFSKQRFWMHVQSHEVGTFPCSQCSEVFDTRITRTIHRLKIHRKGIRYTCPQCSDVFTSYYARVRHLSDKHNADKV
ncbi:zinc finger protein draculin-like isoform X13 [Leptidea sinapis]|uniref:zinc finger protein draculin-like isoform X13 n=1 Tax=Leptidea sinapis TaxID=189913 RepID=UPI0021C4915D|nr:zinc finger protein draculin-like isoform X13 [Leptidea sinapis]